MPIEQTSGLTAAAAGTAGVGGNADRGFQPFGDDGFDFFDLLDIVNPLQHIPVVSTIYREVTGDEISPAARVAGGSLFGGLIGAVASVANVVVEETTGKDVGEHVVTWFSDENEEAPAGDGVQVADADGAGEPVFGASQGMVTVAPQSAWAHVASVETRPAAAARPLAAALPRRDEGLSQVAQRRLEAIEGTAPASPEATPAPVDAGMVREIAFGQAPAPVAAPTTPVEKVGAAPMQSAFAAQTLRDSQQQADAFVALRHRMVQRAAAPAPNAEKPAPAAAGATAADGGWFSDAMIGALDKYRQTQTLGREEAKAPHLDTVN